MKKKKKQNLEIDKTEAVELNKNLPTIKEILKKEIKMIKDAPKNLDELYTRVRRWIYITDTDRIDVILAVALTVKEDDKPLWIFFVGGSGDAKTELLKSLEALPHSRKIDQITPNTLASGRKGESDLGAELTNRHTLLLFTDLACLTSLNKDEKKKIWSQFRNLYDGEIYKKTGSGGEEKKYENCHVTILGASTSALKNEYHIHQQLGTRELLYDTDANPEETTKKMEKALEHAGKEAIMKEELKATMCGFLMNKKFNPDIQIPLKIKDLLFDQCKKLSLLRAGASETDWRTGEIGIGVEIEVTTRLIQQFTLLYKALKSLEPNYSDARFIRITERFVKSSGHPVRYDLFNFFKKNNNDEFSVFDLHQQLKYSRISISAQCEALWHLNFLNKKFVEKTIGYEGSNRWKEVAYYSYDKNQEELKNITITRDDKYSFKGNEVSGLLVNGEPILIDTQTSLEIDPKAN